MRKFDQISHDYAEKVTQITKITQYRILILVIMVFTRIKLMFIRHNSLDNSLISTSLFCYNKYFQKLKS